MNQHVLIQLKYFGRKNFVFFIIYFICFFQRTYGIESMLVNQILDILIDHLLKHGNERLDICTIRTLSQFMIERKDIIIHLLEYALKCQPVK